MTTTVTSTDDDGNETTIAESMTTFTVLGSVTGTSRGGTLPDGAPINTGPVDLAQDLNVGKTDQQVIAGYVVRLLQAFGIQVGGGGITGAAAKTAAAARSTGGLGGLFANGVPSASRLARFGQSPGWKMTQTSGGPMKFVDQNGVVRMTLKSGSSRAPGSATPHVELRNAAGQRISPSGTRVTRRSPANHSPINWDF